MFNPNRSLDCYALMKPSTRTTKRKDIKSTNLLHFIDLGWSQNAGMAMKRYMKKDLPHGSS